MTAVIVGGSPSPRCPSCLDKQLEDHPPFRRAESVTSSIVQELRFDPSTDPATKVALTRNDIAHQSVQALLDDLEYVITTIAEPEQGAAARAVLDHHRPAVNDALLSEEGRRLQHAARAALHSLSDNGEQTFDDVLIIEQPAASHQKPAANKLQQLGITAAMTGGIAAGGFAIGAILQRLI